MCTANLDQMVTTASVKNEIEVTNDMNGKCYIQSIQLKLAESVDRSISHMITQSTVRKYAERSLYSLNS